MKLSEWAKKVGVSYQTAWRWFRANKMPVRTEQTQSGTVIVYEDEVTNREFFIKKSIKNDPVLKYCGACKQVLLKELFNKNRSTKDGFADWCKQCMVVYQRQWEQENQKKMQHYRKEWEIQNKQRRQAQHQQWYQDNKESASTQMKIWYSDNRNKVLKTQKEYELKNKYNLSLDDYYKKFDEQNGLCAICGQPEVLRTNEVINLLAVDHDHTTGEVRALLCRCCNLALRNIKENIKIAESMISYLKKYKNE